MATNGNNWQPPVTHLEEDVAALDEDAEDVEGQAQRRVHHGRAAFEGRAAGDPEAALGLGVLDDEHVEGHDLHEALRVDGKRANEKGGLRVIVFIIEDTSVSSGQRT